MATMTSFTPLYDLWSDICALAATAGLTENGGRNLGTAFMPAISLCQTPSGAPARIFSAFLASLALTVPACGKAGPNLADEDAVSLACHGHLNTVVCDGTEMVTCGPQGQELSRRECEPMPCVWGVGCAVCVAGQRRCEGHTLMACNDDMGGWHVEEVCDPAAGESCDPETLICVNPCEIAAERRASVGCEYLAVDMENPVDGDSNAAGSCFVVIAGNVQAEGTAVVTVEDESHQVLDFPGVGTEHLVEPGDLALLPITGSYGYCWLDPARDNATTLSSGMQPGSVFRIKSTLPIVAYQMNPYDAAAVHSTDGALLIPVPALGTQYLTANYVGLTNDVYDWPASTSIVAAQDGTTVSVSPSVALKPGGPVPAGGRFEVTLDAMEHLQILSASYEDLTSTLVTASAPVAVFSGSVCSFIPPYAGACDHLEEQMPPLSAWGTLHVAAFPPRRAAERTIWRVVAAVDGTRVSFDPYSQYDTVLNQREVLEIDEADSFVLETSSTSPDPQAPPPPVLVVNYLKGSKQTALESNTTAEALGNLSGDPAMTLSVPVEQYLDSYVFLSDPTYAYSFVVVARVDPSEPVHLDCLDPIPESKFEAVAGPYQRAVVTLASETGHADGTCTSGVHRIWSASPFGIWVYGYYDCTSYGYPGGARFEQINDVIIVE